MEIRIDASDFKPYDVIDLNRQYGEADHYKIVGAIPEQTIVKARGAVTVSGNIGNHSTLDVAGILHIHAIAANHVTLHAKSIECVKIGTDATITATDGGIFVPYIGDRARLKATGYIHFDTADNDVQAVAGADFTFNKLGDDAVLKGASIRSKMSIGDNAQITATQGKVHAYCVGDNSIIFSAKPAEITYQGKNVRIATYIPPPETRVSSNNTLSPEGCHIFKDLFNKRYVIDDANWRTYGDTVMGSFIGHFIDLYCDVTKGPAIAPDGTAFEAHFIAFPESQEAQQKARALVQQFVAKHKVRGDD